MHATNWFVILLLMGVGLAALYMLLLMKLKRAIAQSNLKVADRLVVLDDAIRALETRLAEHHPALAVAGEQAKTLSAGEQQAGEASREGQDVSSEIHAVIAAAAIAALGANASVKSLRSIAPHATSPWSQQGRALVQGSHNLRVRR